MGVESLLESALEQAGTVVAILVNPERGAGATIGYVNQTLAGFVGRPRAALQGAPLRDLAAFVASPAVAATLIQALASGKAGPLELKLRVAGVMRTLALRLTFPPAEVSGPRRVIITGREAADAQAVTKTEDDLRRLLASMFIGINAPVAIVTADGEITMANPAFHHLLGTSPEELKRIRVDDLTPPEHAAAARAARAKQLVDGERYEMKIETLVKGGGRVSVWLTSVLLRDGDRRLRVVTLTPLTAGVTRLETVPVTPRRDTGELRAVSLEAFRSAFGAAWERMSSRAMLRADQIIRRRLGRDDTVSRIDDHRFIIWFESADHERNETSLGAIVRDVRLRFLTEFGEEAAEHVSATLVPGIEPGIERAAPAGQGRKITSVLDFYDAAEPADRRGR